MPDFPLTERARAVLALAQDEARELQHQYVGTEHVLLGIVAEGEGVAAAVLRSLHVEPDEVRLTIGWRVKRGAEPARAGELPYTSRARKSLMLAAEEAHALAHDRVGTEHLLLGLLREERGVAAQVLGELGVTLDAARSAAVLLLATGAEPSPPATTPPAVAAPGAGEGVPDLERRRALLEASWLHVRGLLDLAERTNTPARLERSAEGGLELVVGDDLVRAPVPRWPND